MTDKIAAVILDVDGTLYQQSSVRWKMAAELIAAHALKPVEGYALFRFLKSYRKAQERLRGSDLDGRAAEIQFASACESSHTDAVAARAYLDRWFYAAPLKHVRAAIRPGTVDFLSAMKARGIKLGVVSDYPATSKLEALGVLDYFTAVVSAYDPEVKAFKPDPSGLLLCAEKLGVAPQEVLYVGDRHEVDAECARRAGAYAAILEAGSRQRSSAPPWCSASSFPDLLSELLSRQVLP